MWTERKAPSPKRAAATLDSLCARHAATVRTPLAFLPKSGHGFVCTLREKDPDAAQRTARDTWMGTQFDGGGMAEATPATRMALRGRDPFYDEDAESLKRFAALSVALFTALDEASPLDPAVLA